MGDAVLETCLRVARLVRAEARRHRPAGLSLSEFRALAYLGAYPGATLTELAEYVGLGLPTASKLVETLRRRGDLTRRADPADRRRSVLALTRQGKGRVDAAMRVVRAQMRRRLGGLTAAEARVVRRAMAILEPLMASAAGSAARGGADGR
ncbi:MAG TPA: MarR family transcriptional regulator [Gemmatimonadales bacterium]|jgi:DNA-binding MarR family transcriptional regulator|nr:MarR family transcriptional regulator [Gemmatimonadales bacterium]